jgi:hypothetical protein
VRRRSYINKVLYSDRSWTCLQVLFESLFSLTELLDMAVFPNYEVMFGQTLNYFVQNYNSVQCDIFVSCLSCYCFIKGVLNIRDTNTTAKKYSRLYRPINLFMFRIYNKG